MSKQLKFETLAIQSTQTSDTVTGAVTTPINLSTTFKREVDGSYKSGYVYTRIENPNRRLLEDSLTLLEKGTVGFAFSSGMAAITALFNTLKLGDHLLLPHDVYYSTKAMAEDLFGTKGVEISTVVMSDLKAVKKAIKKNTAIVWLETPSNPQLNVSDIAKISKLAHKVGAICAVDSTWPSPVLQRPIEHGADVVMHSTSKYFGGHSDVMYGAAVFKDKARFKRAQQTAKQLGNASSPDDAYQILRGFRSVLPRFRQQEATSLALAEWLMTRDEVQQVLHPAVSDHPDHALWKRDFTGGGCLFSVVLKPLSEPDVLKFIDALQLFGIGYSYGGFESLAIHCDPQLRRDCGETLSGPLVRFACGLEAMSDLKLDIEQALATVF